MNITPRFSFNYNGKPFDLADAKVTPEEYGFLYKLADELQIELHREEFPAYNAVMWTLWFENKGAHESGLISDILDCDATWCFAGGTGETSATAPEIYETAGNLSYETYLHADMTALECEVKKRVLARGASRSYHPWGGRSSSGVMPFFDIYLPGHGLIVAIGWSGQWKATFTHQDGQAVRICSGLEYTSFKLRAGERIRTSSVLLLEYRGHRTHGSNLFRRFVKNELCPYAPERYPFALEGMGMPTAKHLDHIAKFAKHGVRADYYWIDAGWYGKGGTPGAGDWYKQVGNWQVRPDEHPDGLRDVVKAIHKSGMELLLWMEPERAYPGTDLAVAHPDWLYPLDGFYLLLRLDRDEVREYLFDMICGFIDRLGIKCLRQDFNMEPLQSWRITDEMYRGGMNEIKYVMNLYRLWDDLRAKYPDLVIDNCASGGRRIDVETLKRAVPVWRTDAFCEPNCDPDAIQTQNFGFNRFISCAGGVCKRAGDTYATRSSYAPAYVGSWWWTDRPEPTEEQFAWMAKMCEEYRSLRPYFSCDFYPLENCGWSHEHGGWAAFRYDRPEENDGIVIAFRREGSSCTASKYILEGLRAAAVYTVTDLDTNETREVAGKTLAEEGLEVTIPNRRESRILLYKLKSE
ncbi:MAG: alpha-galactosidase [Clostridia bacterium]|nr:alpha-galactosidase [Clostridia bacterium]